MRWRVLLIGQGVTSLDALEALAGAFDVVALVRGGATAETDTTSVRAGQLGIPVRANTSLAAVTAAVAGLRPDCVVVSSYDRILPASLLTACPFVNVHYSPLPRYRGRATVNWAIINGESTTAMTVHCLVPALDAGGILAQVEVPITSTATVQSLYTDLNSMQRRHLADAVTRRLHGDQGVPQDESAATYACTRLPSDGEIDWSWPTVAIDRLVRGLGGAFPYAFTYQGVARIDIVRAQPAPNAPHYEGRIPGRVVAIRRDAGEVDVLTGDGTLRLHELRAIDSAAVPASHLVRSVRDTLGTPSAVLVAGSRDRERPLT